MEVYELLSGRIAPLTSRPFQRSSAYAEYPPCEALKPYIRCYWGGAGQYGSRIVIPDLCADIIFEIDRYENKAGAFFCGVSDTPFWSDGGSIGCETFGIRFYAWTAALFAEDSLHGTLNAGADIGCHFPQLERELAPRIFEAETLPERIALAESFLLRNIGVQHGSALFIEAVGEILERRGNCSAGLLAKELHVCDRQLERVFAEYAGLPPKKLASLVRYQYLWRDILFEQNFTAAEKALEYGYTDQSHLLNDFRRFHSMTLRQAREEALKDQTV